MLGERSDQPKLLRVGFGPGLTSTARMATPFCPHIDAVVDLHLAFGHGCHSARSGAAGRTLPDTRSYHPTWLPSEAGAYPEDAEGQRVP